MDEALNGTYAPCIPLSDQLLIELFAILHTGLPAIQDIAGIRIEGAAPLSGLLVGGSGATPQPAADRALGSTDALCDLDQRQTMFAQQEGLLEAVFSLGLPGLEERLDIGLLLRSPGSRTWKRVPLRVVPVSYSLCTARRPPEIGTAASQEALKRVRQIADHMEPVCNLDRLGSRFSCCCRVLRRAISTDDFHLRMSMEPCGKCAPTAIFQQVHDVVSFEIDQNGAITPLTILRKLCSSSRSVFCGLLSDSAAGLRSNAWPCSKMLGVSPASRRKEQAINEPTPSWSPPSPSGPEEI